jgi:HD-GYP domain-containing protein (c-di-GMP phosphodiesterase class II)
MVMVHMLSSLRARVLLPLAIPFAAMLGMTIYHVLGERAERVTSARTQVLDTARLIAQEQERIIEHLRHVMWSLALLPAVNRGVASKKCNRALAAALRQEPSLSNLSLALANGNVICNATPTAQAISISDRAHFNTAIQTRKFAVGGYIVSRSTGKPSIGLSLPLLDEAGVPRADVAASASVAWMDQELNNARLSQGARVVVVDGKGLVLARHPDPEGWVGKRATDLPLLKSILAKEHEGTEDDVGLDGIRRIFGFVPLYRTATGQAYLWVAVRKDAIVEPAQRVFMASLLIELALLVLTVAATWLGTEALYLRRITALTETAEELGKGNLDARAGLKIGGDEIGRLAQSFDGMADAYQHNEEKLRKSLAESINALCGTAALRNPYLAGHQRRVASLAAAIAKELGLPTDEIHGVQLAASIHDLGKMQVPADILSKPRNSLNDAEARLVKAHAQAGYDTLKEIALPWPIQDMVLQHHELLDGSGYPQGLKGDQILRGARIIAVADAVDKITVDEPYCPAPGLEAALAQIRQDAGTKLDAQVVDACERVFRQGFRFGNA